MQFPTSLPTINTDIISSTTPIEIGRQAREEGRQIADRNLLKEVGGIAAGGNYLEAARAAMRGGQLDTGVGLLKTKAGFDAADTEKRLKLFDFFARGGEAADTPEKWEALLGMAQGAYGPDTDLSQFRDFNKRAQVIQFLRSNKEQLEREKLQAEIGKINAEASLHRARAAGGGMDAPSGFRWDPTKPGTLQAIEGGPATRLSAETAGRMSMMQTARQSLPSARDVFLRKWGAGSVAENAVSQVPYVGDIGWLSGDVGRARRSVRLAIEAALRAMTGAAAPDSEVDRYESLFMPGVNDDEASARQKLDALDEFMQRSEEIITRGRRTDTPPLVPSRNYRSQTQSSNIPMPRSLIRPRSSASSPPVLTPEQARRAPPGTVFRTPDGRTLRVPGR